MKVFLLHLVVDVFVPCVLMEYMNVDSPEPRLSRLQADYVLRDEKFELKRQRYKGQQYSQIYFFRLTSSKQYVNSLIRERWPTLPVTNILGLHEGKSCVVIGTLYKQMRLKPNVLDEYSKERSAVPLVAPRNFMDADDYLILEDESGRVKLVGGGFSPAVYVTGIVVAVCGQAGKDGEFHVKEILEPGLAPQPSLENGGAPENDKYVALVSGLRIGGNEGNPLQVQLLVDHLTGHLGGGQEQSLSAQIVRVVLAGDSVELQSSPLHGQPLSSKEQRKLGEPMKELDLVLTQLAAAIPVDIMPGARDPANFSLPQQIWLRWKFSAEPACLLPVLRVVNTVVGLVQPLHQCLFPGATLYSTFVTATNPHEFELDGVIFLGTSGQNIDDLDKYSEANDPVDHMERTLRWRHIAPTAPDTLGCYPFHDRDPFLVEPSCPHVYFCGNQDKFSTRFITGPQGQCVRLICIPRFVETGVAVLNLLYFLLIGHIHVVSKWPPSEVYQDKIQQVSLKTLDCYCLTLSTSFLTTL